MRRLGALLCGVLLGAQVPGAKDKCPACGMFVAKFPTWVAVIRGKDGSLRFADGPKDALKVLRDPARYGLKGGEPTVLLKDYYSLKPVPAPEAWFVVDSDVRGPMGRELVPFATEADAQAFRKDHRGRAVLRLADVTAVLLRELE